MNENLQIEFKETWKDEFLNIFVLLPILKEVVF